MDQESKKRLFGSFSRHILTKKVRPFPRLYPSKMTLVLSDTPTLPQPFLIEPLAERLKPDEAGLKGYFRSNLGGTLNKGTFFETVPRWGKPDPDPPAGGAHLLRL